jgi:hypothetical protein
MDILLLFTYVLWHRAGLQRNPASQNLPDTPDFYDPPVGYCF